MTARTIIASALLVAAMLPAGCTAGSGPEQAAPDTALLYRDHPLAGRIWMPGSARYGSEEELNAAVAGARFVLIGEKHDNPAHHRIQARIVDGLVSAGRRPALVFEMLTESQQPAIDTFLAAGPADAAGLGGAVGWEKTGWPDWTMYQPIVDAGLAAGAPVLAGGLDRDVTREVARGGADALGEDKARALRLDRPIPQAMRAEMRDEIHYSHCEQLPEQMLDPMVSVTLAKDAVMAARLIEGAALPDRGSAVLIAGDGHVRADRGVPWHLAGFAPDASVVTVGIVEVVAGRDGPADYAEIFDGTVLPYDFVWFTPRVDDEDPCEVFAEQLRKAGEHRQEKGGAGETD